MTKSLCPIFFKPLLIPKPWGDIEIKGKIYGEEFMVSTIEGLETVCRTSNKSLTKLIEENPELILGKRVFQHFGPHLPVYQKRLAASDNLSIQVHPDNEQSQKMKLGNLGKEEAWYITKVKPGAAIYVGFKPNVSAQDLEQQLKSNQPIENLLNKIEVHPGEMYYIPARTVHAVGKGVELIEPQQSSNVTFRVYDWNRVDAAGNPRELHVQESLEVIDFSGKSNKIDRFKLTKEGSTWVNAPYFCFYEYDLKKSDQIHREPNEAYEILYVHQGEVELKGGDWAGPLQQGESALLPGGLSSYSLRNTGVQNSSLLITTLPSQI